MATVDPWTLPGIKTGRNTSRGIWNDMFNRLRGNSIDAAADPPDSTPGEWHTRSDLAKLYIRDMGDATWLEVGPVAVNLGMVRIDGSNAFTGTVDLGAQIVSNWKTNGGSISTAAELLEIKVGGLTRVIQCNLVV